MRIEGVALGRFALIDGRPAKSVEDVAEMVAHFVAGTVPILSRHGGMAVGTLDTLRADGRDLRFTGSVVDYPDLTERLRSGARVSIETVRELPPPIPGTRHAPIRVGLGMVLHTLPYFRGRLQVGMNLIGIAFEDRPAAPGSIMWSVPR